MRSARKGYTLIEIMISVVIMTIGAAGIMAMQGASARSNQDAAQTSLAINFATSWMERVKRDARMWTATGSGSLAATRYLSEFTKTGESKWFLPQTDTTNFPSESAAASVMGFETPLVVPAGSGLPIPYYCVNMRLTTAHQTGGNLDALRVDVMVWWPRSDSVATTVKCSDGPLSAAQINGTSADASKFRKHFLSTVVTWRDPTVTFP